MDINLVGSDDDNNTTFKNDKRVKAEIQASDLQLRRNEVGTIEQMRTDIVKKDQQIENLLDACKQLTVQNEDLITSSIV